MRSERRGAHVKNFLIRERAVSDGLKNHSPLGWGEMSFQWIVIFKKSGLFMNRKDFNFFSQITNFGLVSRSAISIVRAPQVARKLPRSFACFIF